LGALPELDWIELDWIELDWIAGTPAKFRRAQRMSDLPYRGRKKGEDSGEFFKKPAIYG
jgi:hypothetical protein